MTKPKAAPRRATPTKETTTCSAREVIDALKGFRSLIAIGFPVDFSLAMRQRVQALRFAATPIEEELDALTMRCAKRKGNALVASPAAGQVVLDERKIDRYNTERRKILGTMHTIAALPIHLADVPREVNGAEIVIKDEFELLGPFLQD
jgi:hypothetical protein